MKMRDEMEIRLDMVKDNPIIRAFCWITMGFTYKREHTQLAKSICSSPWRPKLYLCAYLTLRECQTSVKISACYESQGAIGVICRMDGEELCLVSIDPSVVAQDKFLCRNIDDSAGHQLGFRIIAYQLTLQGQRKLLNDGSIYMVCIEYILYCILSENDVLWYHM